MANQITRDIYVLRKSIIEPIHYVRLTNAVDIVFNMRDYDIPSGAVAAVYAQKPDGTAVYSNATISENTVTVEMTTQMVAVLGVGHLQVRIQSGSNSADVLCSFVVPLIVEPNFTEGDFPPSQNENGFFGDVEEHLQQVESDMTTMKEEWTEFQSDITQQVQEIQEEQTTQGNEITDLQKKVAKLDEEKSPALVLDASGSWVTVEDSGDSAANGLTIHGKSTQVVTTGAQLWQNPGEGTVNGVTLTQLEDGWINLNGTCTQSNNFIVFSRSLETGEYTLSIEKIGSFPDDYNSLAQVSSHETGKYISIANNSSVLFASSQLTGANDYQYRIRIEEGFSYNNAKVRVMFQKGNEVTPWEPYTGGAPSPSPDYPQEITSVGDSGSVEVVSTGANLYTGGNLYNVTGTESKTFLALGTGMRLDAICDNVSGSVSVYMHADYYDKDSNRLGSNGRAIRIEEENVPYVFEMTGIDADDGEDLDMSNVRKVRLDITNYIGYDGVFNVRNIMIQPLITDKPLNDFSGYEQEPSTATFSTPNGLPGIPVDSGGNYIDADGQQWICDEIDTKAGVYRKRVGKITFDGGENEEWLPYKDATFNGFMILEPNMKSGNRSDGMCDRFTIDKNNSSETYGIWLGSDNQYVYFHNCNPSIASSTEEWRTWLSTHSVTLIYPLETPVETPLSDAELIEAGNLRTFATTTNVTTEDPVEPEITLEYAADLKTYIDKKLAEISAATLEMQQTHLNNQNRKEKKMYQVIKNVINSGDYELEALLSRIDTMFIRGKITEEQEVELIRLARENADPVHSYAPLEERVDALYTEMDSLRGILEALEDRIEKLENDGTEPEEPEVPEEPTEQEEWPQYVQPTGAHDAYNTGDKITYNGVHYICLMNGCVWSPDVYPDGWTTEEKHEEPEEPEEPSTLPAPPDDEALQEEVK